MVSEAQRQAAQKWDAKNLDRMSFAAPYGTKEEIQEAAKAVGMSTNKWIVQTLTDMAKQVIESTKGA